MIATPVPVARSGRVPLPVAAPGPLLLPLPLPMCGTADGRAASVAVLWPGSLLRLVGARRSAPVRNPVMVVRALATGSGAVRARSRVRRIRRASSTARMTAGVGCRAGRSSAHGEQSGCRGGRRSSAGQQGRRSDDVRGPTPRAQGRCVRASPDPV